jgi:hypothetical protein
MAGTPTNCTPGPSTVRSTSVKCLGAPQIRWFGREMERARREKSREFIASTPPIHQTGHLQPHNDTNCWFINWFNRPYRFDAHHQAEIRYVMYRLIVEFSLFRQHFSRTIMIGGFQGLRIPSSPTHNRNTKQQSIGGMSWEGYWGHRGRVWR